MALVIFTISLSGGVGKTTTTVALAEAYSAVINKRVLIIDLDPRANATAMLIGESRWRELSKGEHTLARLFRDALDRDNTKFDFDATLQKCVSDVGAASSIDLLPSGLDLIDVEAQLTSTPSGRFDSANPVEILWHAVKSRLDNYDIVLVDCPPNLGIITQNVLRISHAYIIPAIPDVLSANGIPQIVKRVREFSQEIAKPIELLGIVATMYQANSAVHKNVLRSLRASSDALVFETIIPQESQIVIATEHQECSRTFEQKYGYVGLAEKYPALAREVQNGLEFRP